MPKLYFRYGTVGSAKTLNLLAVAHNYRQQDKTVYLLKPAVDTRFGVYEIGSRTGMKITANYVVNEESFQELAERTPLLRETFGAVLVDEAQFLFPDQINFLREVTRLSPVICYGLRTDFRNNLFLGSRRLLEIADSIEEVKTTCKYCNKKAILNMRLVNGQPTIDGPQIHIGLEESYSPTCWWCYSDKLDLA